jgi:hypothetical protein
MREQRHMSTSIYGVGYKKPKKQIISAAERKRQAESLRTYRPGGDDAS